MQRLIKITCILKSIGFLVAVWPPLCPYLCHPTLKGQLDHEQALWQGTVLGIELGMLSYMDYTGSCSICVGL